MTESQQFVLAFGCRLRQARWARNLTQTAMSRRLGLKPHGNTTSDYELGRKCPSIWKVVQLARILEVPLCALVPEVDGLVPCRCQGRPGDASPGTQGGQEAS